MTLGELSMNKRAEVWTISTRKGGVLKTSLTVNLAGALASQHNARVLIVDMDAQGNSLLSFGQNPDDVPFTIHDILMGNISDPLECAMNVYENIDIIPANDDMSEFEFEVIPDRERFPEPFMLLKNGLEMLRNEYDYILIDTPPNFGLIQGNALMFADRVLVPFQPEPYSMRALVKIVKTIENFKEKHNPALDLMGVVATLVDMRTSLHCEIMEDTRHFCRDKGIPIMDTIIPRSIRFAASITYEGLPATIVNPTHKAVEHYFDLLNEVKKYVSSK